MTRYDSNWTGRGRICGTQLAPKYGAVHIGGLSLTKDRFEPATSVESADGRTSFFETRFSHSRTTIRTACEEEQSSPSRIGRSVRTTCRLSGPSTKCGTAVFETQDLLMKSFGDKAQSCCLVERFVQGVGGLRSRFKPLLHPSRLYRYIQEHQTIIHISYLPCAFRVVQTPPDARMLPMITS